MAEIKLDQTNMVAPYDLLGRHAPLVVMKSAYMESWTVIAAGCRDGSTATYVLWTTSWCYSWWLEGAKVKRSCGGGFVGFI
jgi:hypothetical protein